MGRIARSFRLMKSSWVVLMKDKELLWLPLFSSVFIALAAASFVVPFAALGVELPEEDSVGFYLLLLAFYVVTYTIGIFFQAAVVAGANERMRGGDPTVGSALAAAGRRFGSILAWGFVAGTVGMILKSIQERSEIVGKIVVGLIGAAWSLATLFVVPVLVIEGVGVGRAFGRSWSIFKETWGEAVVGTAGLGIAAFLVSLPILLVAGLLAYAGLVIVGVVVAVLALVVLGIVMSALQGVYVTALYRYATTGETADGFDADDTVGAYRPKAEKRRRR